MSKRPRVEREEERRRWAWRFATGRTALPPPPKPPKPAPLDPKHVRRPDGETLCLYRTRRPRHQRDPSGCPRCGRPTGRRWPWRAYLAAKAGKARRWAAVARLEEEDV